MTDERQLVVAYLGVAIASAVSVTSSAGLTLVALSLIAILVGFWRKAAPSAAVAGVFLYYPLAVAFGHFMPAAWNYIASATLVIILSERLSFEYSVSSILDTPLGVDEESRSQAASLSKAHGLRLLWFAGAALGVAALSLFASAFTPFFPLLTTASVALVLVLWVYTHR